MSLKERFEEFLFFILGLGVFFVSHPVLPPPPFLRFTKTHQWMVHVLQANSIYLPVL